MLWQHKILRDYRKNGILLLPPNPWHENISVEGPGRRPIFVINEPDAQPPIISWIEGDGVLVSWVMYKGLSTSPGVTCQAERFGRQGIKQQQLFLKAYEGIPINLLAQQEPAEEDNHGAHYFKSVFQEIGFNLCRLYGNHRILSCFLCSCNSTGIRK